MIIVGGFNLCFQVTYVNLLRGQHSHHAIPAAVVLHDSPVAIRGHGASKSKIQNALIIRGGNV